MDQVKITLTLEAEDMSPSLLHGMIKYGAMTIQQQAFQEKLSGDALEAAIREGEWEFHLSADDLAADESEAIYNFLEEE